MTPDSTPARATNIPSLDRLLNDPAFAPVIARYTRTQVTAALRSELEQLRRRAVVGSLRSGELSPHALAGNVDASLERHTRPRLRAVFNLSGTVLHTNLGRALLSDTAVHSVVR
ncbi:MAG: L-seryl-tRNA(Sec) selenium transferase, partial [Steroidobacteraceae bacterium]